MKWKIVACILITAVLILPACGIGDDAGEPMSLEPHSLEADNATGVSDINGGSGSVAAGTDGTVSAGKGNEASGSGSMENGTGQGTAASVVGTESEQSVPASGAGVGTQPSSTGSSRTYRDIYSQKVNENDSTAKVYSLIYLDADEIPELVIHMGDESYSIYTVKDNELFCVADSVGTVELTYFERSGVIAAFSRWNGGGDEGGYGSSYYRISGDRTLTDGDEPVLSYSYNATYDDKGVYTGTGVTDYFYMGQEIDEAAYEEKMKSLGIAEGEDRLCMENSRSKEEIIAVLSR